MITYVFENETSGINIYEVTLDENNNEISRKQIGAHMVPVEYITNEFINDYRLQARNYIVEKVDDVLGFDGITNASMANYVAGLLSGTVMNISSLNEKRSV
jgi:hypothetical protein